MGVRGTASGLLVIAAFVIGVAVYFCHGSGETPSADAAPKILPAAKPSKFPTVAAIGDITCEVGGEVTTSTCQQRAVANAITRAKPDSVWLLGDIQYLNGELGQFKQAFGRDFAALRNRWRPSPGNHEYNTPNASGYYEFFGKSAGPNREGFYSFDLGKWHVVSLNGNCTIIDCKQHSFQANWLRKDLAKHKNKCTAAFWHQPLYSSGKEHGGDPSVRALYEILDNRGADLVLNGHDHDFEVFGRQDAFGNANPKSVMEIVAGTGGKSWYEFNPPQPNSKIRIGNTFGFLSLTLNPKSFNWRYISKDDKVLAHGSANCV